ncbi:hypothetical protein Tco_1021566 [Tanacetum coccineum]
MNETWQSVYLCSLRRPCFQVLVKSTTGYSVPNVLKGSLCPSCNAHRMDQWGDHAVHCSSEVGVKFRHNLVRDILVDICSKTFCFSIGSKGKDAGLDVTCISPFAGMGASSWVPGVALHNAVEKKKRKYQCIVTGLDALSQQRGIKQVTQWMSKVEHIVRNPYKVTRLHPYDP